VAAGSGVTLGVEEEYHLVDADTVALRAETGLVKPMQECLGADGMNGTASSEISSTLVEIATPICSTLPEVRERLVTARRAADKCARDRGLRILAAGSHPFAQVGDMRLTVTVRYLRLWEQWGVLATQQGIAGCHVHVSVADPDTAITVMDRSRPWLATLLALTGSSPFWEGIDTGYQSFRTVWFGRWAMTGPPDPLGDRAGYDALVDQLVRTGVIDDASYLYWDVRPSVRYPTLEFRVADVCPRVDDAVLHAGLVRSLVRTLAREADEGTAVPSLRPEVARAARWRAARHGVDGQLFDPGTFALRPAADVVNRFLRYLRPDLEEHGEWDVISDLAGDVLARGTSSRSQRTLMEQTSGDLVAVTRELVQQTVAAD
jgi:YbdK family carboxylate-amine ligase